MLMRERAGGDACAATSATRQPTRKWPRAPLILHHPAPSVGPPVCAHASVSLMLPPAVPLRCLVPPPPPPTSPPPALPPHTHIPIHRTSSSTCTRTPLCPRSWMSCSRGPTWRATPRPPPPRPPSSLSRLPHRAAREPPKEPPLPTSCWTSTWAACCFQGRGVAAVVGGSGGDGVKAGEGRWR